MKTMITAAALVTGALVLSGCENKAEETPAADATGADMMAPAETTPMAGEDAAAPAGEMDPTGNPIGMGAPPAAEGAEAAPAAE